MHYQLSSLYDDFRDLLEVGEVTFERVVKLGQRAIEMPLTCTNDVQFHAKIWRGLHTFNFSMGRMPPHYVYPFALRGSVVYEDTTVLDLTAIKILGVSAENTEEGLQKAVYLSRYIAAHLKAAKELNQKRSRLHKNKMIAGCERILSQIEHELAQCSDALTVDFHDVLAQMPPRVAELETASRPPEPRISATGRSAKILSFPSRG